MRTSLRPLLRADAPAMEALIHGDGVGFQQTSSDLRALLDTVSEGGCLGAFDDRTGALLSMAALPTYSPSKEHEWSWLAYVATDVRARRRGLASSLVMALLSTVPASRPLGLYGSALGAPIYERMGFADAGRAQLCNLPGDALSVIGAAETLPQLDRAHIVPASSVLPAVSSLIDRTYSASHSGALYSQWARPTASVALVREDGVATGVVLSRPVTDDGVWLGPLIAETAEAAERQRATLPLPFASPSPTPSSSPAASSSPSPAPRPHPYPYPRPYPRHRPRPHPGRRDLAAILARRPRQLTCAAQHQPRADAPHPRGWQALRRQGGGGSARQGGGGGSSRR